MTEPVVRCRRCRRVLTDPPYQARALGRVCGGPIHTGRRPTLPGQRTAEVDDGQLELFVVVVVR